MKEIKLFNKLTKEVDIFQPVKKGKVGIYTCGPTVYSFAHIGNMRSMIFANTLVGVLHYAGYDVNWVVNITDVGHLKGDGDFGEDKMEKTAREENKSIWDIAHYYEDEFWKDWDNLNLIRPTHTPHATGFITEQIEFIKDLEKNGFTYKTSDGIYYDSTKYPDYSKLSGLNIEGQEAGYRVDMGEKKHPADFALWKFSPEGEKRQMEWDSPWGVGFPGWSIECSAMGTSLIGDRIDIHTGGEDAIAVHHTNERAQNFGRYGCEVVQRWIHGGFLVNSGGAKMAKSSGKFLRVQTLIDEGFNPLSFKYLCLTTYYGKQLAYSDEIMKSADNSYKNLLKQTQAYADFDKNANLSEKATELLDKFENAIFNDLNMAVALTVLREVLSSEISNDEKATLISKMDSVFCLKLLEKTAIADIPEEIKQLAEQRLVAKKNKDFALADSLRSQITESGWKLMDTPDGYKLEK